MRALALACLALLPLGSAGADPVAELPWLHGLTRVTANDAGVPGEAGWVLDGEEQCPADAQPPLRLTADLSPVAGRETIAATLTGGIRVTSSEGIELASSAGYPCQGSADALDVLAVGSIFQDRVIVLGFSTGGYREGWRWVGIYRLGFGGEIDALFAGVVETREDGIIRSGSIGFLPGALIYRPPGSPHDSLWVLDPVVHTYTPRGPFDHEAEPHS